LCWLLIAAIATEAYLKADVLSTVLRKSVAFPMQIDYIHANLDCNIGLTELADLAQMSLSHFSRLFKQSTGYSPHQFVIKCRVDRARELLLKSDLSIADITYQVGFANQGHLTNHFKRLLGVTPKVIR
jgi:AraC family transcriptional regulator